MKMPFLDIFRKLKPEVKNDVQPEVENKHTPSAYSGNYICTVPFDGEKNLGELGPIVKYIPDYENLRHRSWQLFLDSDICQIVIRRLSMWVVGKGMKLQAEPQISVLDTEGISMTQEQSVKFGNSTEARWKIYASSTDADYHEEQNLNQLAYTAYLNSKVGGDVLVVLRYIDDAVKVQLIDGAHIVTPLEFNWQGDSTYLTPNGGKVRSGIEYDERMRPVAFHVRKGFNSYERIPVYGKKGGIKQAFLVSGFKYRLDNARAMPLLSVIMETAKKLERYKEATLATVEERAKITLAIEHQLGASGENPWDGARAKGMLGASGLGVKLSDDLPKDITGKELADNVAATTNKSAINLPQGSKITALDSKTEANFGAFMEPNIDLMCAAVQIPPDVAMQKYENSYSSSRAATKDWEHTLMVEREDFSGQFYQPIYNFWLEMEILKNKVRAIGYIDAIISKNSMAIAAYRYARWVGQNVPHIDPVKEVEAVRLKLGKAFDNVPLITLEAATEALNGGDFSTNIQQVAAEYKEADKLLEGIIETDNSHTNSQSKKTGD
jgi:capsid protein